MVAEAGPECHGLVRQYTINDHNYYCTDVKGTALEVDDTTMSVKGQGTVEPDGVSEQVPAPAPCFKTLPAASNVDVEANVAAQNSELRRSNTM